MKSPSTALTGRNVQLCPTCSTMPRVLSEPARQNLSDRTFQVVSTEFHTAPLTAPRPVVGQRLDSAFSSTATISTMQLHVPTRPQTSGSFTHLPGIQSLMYLFTPTLATVLFVVAMLWSGGVWGQTSIWENEITGTNPNLSNPYTTGDVSSNNIAVSGIGRGTGINGTNTNDRYNANSWNTSTIDLDAHYNFTITPNAGYRINFNSFVYNGQRSGNGPDIFAFRTSVDGFVNEIGTPIANGATISLSNASYQNISSAISFRLYGWNANNTNGTFSVNDFTFNGSILGTTVTALTGFSTCLNTAGTAQSFTVNGDGLSPTNATITIAGTTNYEVSTTSATTGFSNSATLTAASGSISGTVWVRLKSSAPAGNHNGELVNISGGGFTVANAIEVSCSGAVNPLPTITLGASPSVCQGLTSANLPYTATANGADQYSINYDAAAETALFSDVVNAALPASPIVLTVPSGAAAAIYNATLTVRNSVTGCVSGPYNITVTVLERPTAGTCNKTDDVCYTNGGHIDLKASGGLAPYNVTWSPAHGMSQPATIMTSSGMVTVTGLQANTTYTFVVKDSNNCQAQ